MEKKIRKIIEEKINPILTQHLGGVELLEVKDKVVYIKMLGACGACPSSQITLENIIETAIKTEISDIDRVSIYQGVSDEMISFAKKIIEKEK